MTESTKLDEPLSRHRLDELEAFLASNAVPQDCMDLEMLDGFLSAVVSGPELIQPSEWLPGCGAKPASVTPVFQDNEQAERIMALVLRHRGHPPHARRIADAIPPLLYHPEPSAKEKRAARRRAPGARATWPA